jgi:hypothetical protein
MLGTRTLVAAPAATAQSFHPFLEKSGSLRSWVLLPAQGRVGAPPHREPGAVRKRTATIASVGACLLPQGHASSPKQGARLGRLRSRLSPNSGPIAPNSAYANAQFCAAASEPGFGDHQVRAVARHARGGLHVRRPTPATATARIAPCKSRRALVKARVSRPGGRVLGLPPGARSSASSPEP